MCGRGYGVSFSLLNAHSLFFLSVSLLVASSLDDESIHPSSASRVDATPQQIHQLLGRALDERLVQVGYPELPFSNVSSALSDNHVPMRRTNSTEHSSTESSDDEGVDEESEDGDQSSDMDSAEHDDKSDVSDEINPLDKKNKEKATENAGEQVISMIAQSFSNKKSFSCPRIKTDLKTGSSIGDLSPEDIRVIASMGDGVPSGVGLFPQTDIEFRGAAFASGGDATIDGLVTIPNILREFSPHLLGVAHGMGSVDSLPQQQLSVSQKGATTKDMPKQADELVRRLGNLNGYRSRDHWVLVIIAVGTEEVCTGCGGPDGKSLQRALEILQAAIPKAFVVLLGPMHVASSYDQKKNMLKDRCACSKNKESGFMTGIGHLWAEAFEDIQEHVDTHSGPTFGILALPLLTITSRYPSTLFVTDTPLMNRKGHSYVSKWLWNRMITGEKYNLTSATLSSDSYYCPSTGCPYFRTSANSHRCALLSLAEAADQQLTLGADGVVLKGPRRTRRKLYTIALVIVVTAFFVALIIGIILYNISKRSVLGRFEEVSDPPPDSPQPDRASEAHAPLLRQNAVNRQSTKQNKDTSLALIRKQEV